MPLPTTLPLEPPLYNLSIKNAQMLNGNCGIFSMIKILDLVSTYSLLILVHIIANIPNSAEECSSTSPVCGRRQTLGPDELCSQGRYGSSLFLLVVIPSGFGFGGSIPVIPARLAHGFARHPVNLRFSQEAYAVRGTCRRLTWCRFQGRERRRRQVAVFMFTIDVSQFLSTLAR